MIPTTRSPLAPTPLVTLASLAAAALVFVAMLAQAHASDGAISALQDHLGVLVYVALPFVFYALMRERRRRHGPRVLWLSSRQRARLSREMTSDIQASK